MQKTIALLVDPVFDADDLEDRKVFDSNFAKRRPHRSSIRGVRKPAITRTLIGSRPHLREAQTILGMLPAKEGALFSGVDANRELALGSALNGYQIIHFGTHGMMDPEHPETSGIMLSFVDRNGNPQDGVLRVAEIYDLRLASRFGGAECVPNCVREEC